MKYTAIVFIGNTGSSWATDESKDKAIKKAVATARKDWGESFGLPDKLNVCLFDMTDATDGWHSDYNGVFNNKTNEIIPLLEVVEA